MIRLCPKCGTASHSPATQCDCGYDFQYLKGYRVAILFAPADEPYMLQLYKHFMPLIRDGIDVWHAGRIAPGSDQSSEFRTALHQANILIALLSADYVASNECYSAEIYDALSHCKTIARVLRACDWQNTPFRSYGPDPDSLPISNQPRPDDAWMELVRDVRSTLQQEPTLDKSFPGMEPQLRADRCRPHQKALVELANQGGHKVIPLDKINTIGRSNENKITIVHPSISRRHCIIVENAGGYFVHDLNSTHGTTVNGDIVSIEGLKHGDEIQFGSIGARFLIVE